MKRKSCVLPSFVVILFMLMPVALADKRTDEFEKTIKSGEESAVKTVEDVANIDDQSLETSDSVTPSQQKPDDLTDIDVVIETSVLSVEVIQDGQDAQPIRNARVIITYDNASEYERKTDSNGKAILTGLPYGTVDVDVTSSGRNSGGGTFVLDEPSKSLTFRLGPRRASD